jgi:hypothetical protein
MGGQRLVEGAEIGTLMLIGQIDALIGGGGADDGDLRNDQRKEQPP